MLTLLATLNAAQAADTIDWVNCYVTSDRGTIWHAETYSNGTTRYTLRRSDGSNAVFTADGQQALMVEAMDKGWDLDIEYSACTEGSATVDSIRVTPPQTRDEPLEEIARLQSLTILWLYDIWTEL